MKHINRVRLLLHHCSDLETLTFDLLPPSSIMITSSYDGIDPRKYWAQNITYKCTLKTVLVRNFVGGLSELNSGCEHEPVLERIELYMPYRLEESQWMIAYEGVQRSVEPVQSLRKNEILVIL
ncbi:LOW QUALITY PROTEIN: hypothetical protein HID58_087782 [Brassica napus]|uniref:Uncharacterized protein n=1 Tax=Brassica napus TaxID=3708 RepID=A0ABQ7XUG0_BRANA|nr:LOW QUALITY PROTEIN: hypothetical protein HID58_087782 [Brassica napus]